MPTDKTLLCGTSFDLQLNKNNQVKPITCISLRWLTVLLLVISLQQVQGALTQAQENYTLADTVLQARPLYGKQARAVGQLLEMYHYRKLKINDSLSSAILDAYLNTLDNSKMYFRQSDIRLFEKYRFQLDDLLRQENVDAAFEIYQVFLQRFYERMNYVLGTLLNQPFDFTDNEFYEPNREKAPWPATEAEQNQIWRLYIKNQVLSLKLAGKAPDEIQETLRKRFERLVKSFKQVQADDVFGYYMNAVTESFDPHTNFFTPKVADLFKQSISQSLEGIGARLQTDNDHTKVVEIVPGGPADKSKLIKVNDRIIGVGQGDTGEMVDVIGWRIDDVVRLIKGPKGTKVRLMLLPAESGLNGPPVTITLVRDKIKLEDQTARKQVIEYPNGDHTVKVGVITLPSFYFDYEAYQKGDPNFNSTTRDIRRIIAELKQEGIGGLVVDLRNNGGGSLQEAINLTGLFIREGPVVQVRNFMNRTDVLNDEDPAMVYEGPLVVLINRFSASASEIFAGAIQDYRRGVIVGESSYGKGTVQTIMELDRVLGRTPEPVGSLKYTIQKFYRITGSSTQFKGVTPDISLPSALEAQQFGESANPAALPWDEIRGTFYQRTPYVTDRLLQQLRHSYLRRLQTDDQLKNFVAEVEETRANMNETKISLNEAVRRKEMEEAEQKRKLRNLKLQPEGTPRTPAFKLEDEYLRQSIIILGEMLAARVG
jgi:carboxyl-terminal processing protease